MFTKVKIWYQLWKSEGKLDKEMCINEISKYINAHVTVSEGCSRLMSFPVHGRDPSMQRLGSAVDNLQMVMFDHNAPEEAIALSKDTNTSCMLQVESEGCKWKELQIP